MWQILIVKFIVWCLNYERPTFEQISFKMESACEEDRIRVSLLNYSKSPKWQWNLLFLLFFCLFFKPIVNFVKIIWAKRPHTTVVLLVKCLLLLNFVERKYVIVIKFVTGCETKKQECVDEANRTRTWACKAAII